MQPLCKADKVRACGRLLLPARLLARNGSEACLHQLARPKPLCTHPTSPSIRCSGEAWRGADVAAHVPGVQHFTANSNSILPSLPTTTTLVRRGWCWRAFGVAPSLALSSTFLSWDGDACVGAFSVAGLMLTGADAMPVATNLAFPCWTGAGIPACIRLEMTSLFHVQGYPSIVSFPRTLARSPSLTHSVLYIFNLAARPHLTSRAVSLVSLAVFLSLVPRPEQAIVQSSTPSFSYTFKTKTA